MQFSPWTVAFCQGAFASFGSVLVHAVGLPVVFLGFDYCWWILEMWHVFIVYVDYVDYIILYHSTINVNCEGPSKISISKRKQHHVLTLCFRFAWQRKSHNWFVCLRFGGSKSCTFAVWNPLPSHQCRSCAHLLNPYYIIIMLVFPALFKINNKLLQFARRCI